MRRKHSDENSRTLLNKCYVKVFIRRDSMKFNIFRNAHETQFIFEIRHRIWLLCLKVATFKS